VDILLPNQTEAQLLAGMSGGHSPGGAIRTVDDARRAAERFLLRGTRVVIVKMGQQGAVIVYRDEQTAQAGGGVTASVPPALARHIPGFRVPVVDTTAAGDAFAGALAVALAEGMTLPEAVRFANAAGALACTKPGAMAAMPARSEVEKLLDPPALK
jgi:ribokinase